MIVEKGNQIRIVRTAQDPLVLTLPRRSEMEGNKRLRWIADSSVTWFFFFAAWSAFYLATLAQAQALGAQRRIAEAEAAARAAQVRALRYQVNPHFLFNTLNSLSSLVLTGRTEKAEEMLLALSTFFRTSLSLDPSAMSSWRRRSTCTAVPGYRKVRFDRLVSNRYSESWSRPVFRH